MTDPPTQDKTGLLHYFRKPVSYKSYHSLTFFSLFFNSKMTVTKQFWSYGFMAYIAENGGFVGLFLGYSLLKLEELIMFCFP